MAKVNQARRKFRITDDKFIEASRTKRSFFTEDKPDFILFDEDFDDPFTDTWKAEIDVAEAEPSDEMVDDLTRQLTEIVDEKMELCRGKFQDAKYFIEKAFKDKPTIWHEFGYNNYDRTRRVQSLMVAFMRAFKKVADKYNTQLSAVGYDAADIAQIETLATAMETANLNQENFIGNIPDLTYNRITKYNIAWDTMVKVCSAGKIKFKANYGKYQRYLLPTAEESGEVLLFNGLVTRAADGTPLENVIVRITELSIQTLTDSEGLYGFGGIPDGTYHLSFTLTGFITQNMEVILADGQPVVTDVEMVAV